MRRHRDASLSLRLSLWLAALAFGGLGAVCAAVYLVTASTLEARQEAELEEKALLVRHLVEEADAEGDPIGLRHTLEDVGVGWAGMVLRLAPPDGAPIFASQGWPLSVGTHDRSMRIGMPWSHAPTGRLVAELRFDTRADTRLLARLRVTLFAAAIAGAGTIALASHAVVRRGLAPLARLGRHLRRIRPGAGAARLDATGQSPEVRELVEHFNGLLGEVDAVYAQLAAFNADVAHELRTPLAILTSDLGVMLSRERSAEDWHDAAGRQLDELQRLSAIVTDMLFLARADRASAARSIEVTSVASLVGEVVEFHEAAMEERGLRVHIDGDAGGRFDAQLLKRAISNLLSNAARFATPGSVVHAHIERPAPARVRVRIVNRGPEIPAEHLPRLFDRFYRVAAARGDTAAHHGLGLAIVAAIAKMHGGSTYARSLAGTTDIGFEVADVITGPAVQRTS
jgi:two-component system, OmpR family, heavy metal sensor histidine kinase CusS